MHMANAVGGVHNQLEQLQSKRKNPHNYSMVWLKHLYTTFTVSKQKQRAKVEQPLPSKKRENEGNNGNKGLSTGLSYLSHWSRWCEAKLTFSEAGLATSGPSDRLVPGRSMLANLFL